MWRSFRSEARWSASGSPYIVRWTTRPSKFRITDLQSSVPSTRNGPPQLSATSATRRARSGSGGWRNIRSAPNARAARATWVVSRGSRPGRCPTRRTETAGGAALARRGGIEPLDPVAPVLELLRALHEALEARRRHPELLGHIGEEPARLPDGLVDLLLQLLVLLVRHAGDGEDLRHLAERRRGVDVDRGVVEVVALVGGLAALPGHPARVDQLELLEEREGLGPFLAELAFHVLVGEPVVGEPLDELQLERRVHGAEDRDELAHVVHDLDPVHRCGHGDSKRRRAASANRRRR